MAQSTLHNYDVYPPRNPKASAYYKCVENNFEELARAWDDMYKSRYGFWRTYVITVIYKYLDCGDLHMGFARVRCENCGHEYLLAFSCKRRQFCPSCHQKRVIEYGEWLLTEMLKDVPHRQWVFSIPKRLRIYFLYDRKLLAKLSICAWKVMNAYLRSVVADVDAVPGASILGNLARYIIRACFSQEKMIYVPAEQSTDDIAIVYTSKDRKSRKVFTALDWLARLTTHIPGRYEQTVRYYGWYSNKSRGMRNKAGLDDTIPAVMPKDMSAKESRQNWARLIQKIYEVDPLVCPKCQGSMKIVAFIEEFDVIENDTAPP